MVLRCRGETLPSATFKSGRQTSHDRNKSSDLFVASGSETYSVEDVSQSRNEDECPDLRNTSNHLIVSGIERLDELL